MIKEIDPNHPIMTVTAGIDPAEVNMIKNYCPEIDILGINTYGGVKNLSSMVKEFTDGINHIWLLSGAHMDTGNLL